jgi:spermidine synthase
MFSPKSDLLPVVVVSGATSLLSQVVVLREFMAVFFGNELILGVILAQWMLLTGLGAFAGRATDACRRTSSVIILVQCALGVLPAATVAALDLLRYVVFPLGSMAGPVEIVASSFVLLLPLCVTTGFLFSLLCAAVSGRLGGNRVKDVYALEAVGSLFGGLLLSLVLVHLLPSMQILLAAGALNAGSALVLAMRHRNRGGAAGAALVLAGTLGVMVICDPDEVVRRPLFPGQEITAMHDTPYGNVTVTRQGGQTNVFENGILLTSSDDPVTAEERVHYAMVQRCHPRSVLIVSGGLRALKPELAKYAVTRVDYVEVNPWLVLADSARDDEVVHIHYDDARTFVRASPAAYDVVLVNTPDPTTASLNRYYTREFLADVKRVLRDSAVVAMSLSATAEYANDEARRSGGAVYATLRSLFAHVLILPGSRDIYLASDAPLSSAIPSLVERRGIATVAVNRFYIDEELFRQRSAFITGALDTTGGTNTDFHPIAYERQLAQWLSQFQVTLHLPLLFAIVGILLLIMRCDAVSIGVLASGFAGSVLQVILLLSFQVLFGSLYMMTGILIASFMAGLAAGSLLQGRVGSGFRTFTRIQLGIAVSALLMPVFLPAVHGAIEAGVISQAAFLCASFVIGGLVGLAFAVAVSLPSGSPGAIAGRLYGADLLGAALGAFLTSAFLVPLMGVIAVNYVAGGAAAGGAAISYIRSRS